MAFSVSIVAVAFGVYSFTLAIGKVLGDPNEVHYVIDHFWGWPAAGFAIAGLCLLAAGNLGWRERAADTDE